MTSYRTQPKLQHICWIALQEPTVGDSLCDRRPCRLACSTFRNMTFHLNPWQLCIAWAPGCLVMRIPQQLPPLRPPPAGILPSIQRRAHVPPCTYLRACPCGPCSNPCICAFAATGTSSRSSIWSFKFTFPGSCRCLC